MRVRVRAPTTMSSPSTATSGGSIILLVYTAVHTSVGSRCAHTGSQLFSRLPLIRMPILLDDEILIFVDCSV